jgi:hypothetical protein
MLRKCDKTPIDGKEHLPLPPVEAAYWNFFPLTVSLSGKKVFKPDTPNNLDPDFKLLKSL